MSTFPTLATGAIAQYPASRVLSFATAVVRFVDRSSQRHRSHANLLRRWVVRLDLLTDAEMAAIESFFRARAGRTDPFLFIDPWDSAEYPGCTFETDEAEFVLGGVKRGRAALIIRENWS